MGEIKMRIEQKLLSIVAILALFSATPAIAITDGELDGEGHPAVGLLIFDVGGGPAWRCSGTLISPTVMLTAGHCTDGATGGRVWFDADEVDILAKGYPFGGPESIEFTTVVTHPLYPTASFIFHDVGIVILSEPVVLDANQYGVLPEVDELDQLKTRRGRQNQMFTAVGYGLQRINPVFVEAERTRMVAYPHLIQINVPGFTGDFSILLSNNHSTGGTCFGDSGGPNFIGNSNVIGGVTSFGINGNCAGTGGVFRVDRQNVLDFVNGWLP
jgi:V8-like Glu-specific endopeptidase